MIDALVFQTTTTVANAGGSNAAPWWGVPVFSGAFLVAGAGLTLGGNYLLERRKERIAEAKAVREQAAERQRLAREAIERILMAGHRLYDIFEGKGGISWDLVRKREAEMRKVIAETETVVDPEVTELAERMCRIDKSVPFFRGEETHRQYEDLRRQLIQRMNA